MIVWYLCHKCKKWIHMHDKHLCLNNKRVESVSSVLEKLLELVSNV